MPSRLLAILLALSVVLWVRNPFGMAFLLALAVTLGFAARMLPDYGAAFLVPTIALTLCLSWFTDLAYMFAAYAEVDGGCGAGGYSGGSVPAATVCTLEAAVSAAPVTD